MLLTNLPSNVIEKFNERWIGEPNSGCWLWTGDIANNYGTFAYDSFGPRKRRLKSRIRAHRLSYLMKHGELSDDLWVLHKCDTPLCVNPDHLFAGTNTDNVKDRQLKHRNSCGERSGRTHLKDNDIRAIRKSTLNGIAVGKIFGVSRATISKIRRGLAWKHVIL